MSRGLGDVYKRQVVAPPEDQKHYNRLGVFYFALFNENVVLEPLLESEIVKKASQGHDFWSKRHSRGLPAVTAGEWERMRVRAYGQGGQKKGSDGHDHEQIAGVNVTLYNSIQNVPKVARKIGGVNEHAHARVIHATS